MEKIIYPPARTSNAEETLAGVAFPNPYQWLEEDSDEVLRWQAAQNVLATRTVEQWPHFSQLTSCVSLFTTARKLSAPRSAGGRWFSLHTPDGATQAVVQVTEERGGSPRTLFDPAAAHPEQPPFLSWLAPSPDGRTLAIGLCADGSENNVIQLIDAVSGAFLPNPPPQVLMDAWAGGVQWLTDSSGFYFTALIGPAHDFDLRIFHHDLTGGGHTREVDAPLPKGSGSYPMLCTEPQGRWVIAMRAPTNACPVAVMDIRADSRTWRPFIDRVDGTVAGHLIGNCYYAMTDVGATRGRIVAIPLDSATPNDPSSWKEIVPQSDAVISGVRPVGNRLYVIETLDAYARVRIFSLGGEFLGTVPMPGRGVISLLHVPGIEVTLPLISSCMPVDSAGFIFGYSSLTTSWGLYLHEPGDAPLQTLIPPDVRIDGAVVEDRSAISFDGTEIPYRVVRTANSSTEGPLPTLLFAYGGFNWPFVPAYPGAMAAFIASGGVFVHCHLRGGGELGREWWEGGRLQTKQNCYQDLYAIAEDLISRGVTRPDLLGVTGYSNGGMMAAVAALQRPDLWRVAVPRVPILDLIGGCREPYGRWGINMDFGDPDNPDEVRRLAGFSPYQLIEDGGAAYPAVYIDAGETDPRCPPWHARKFAARLQAAQTGDAPILLHLWENAGHGFATAKDVEVKEATEWLAFVMMELGLRPPPALAKHETRSSPSNPDPDSQPRG
ncbi:MAG: prolyl oligopeptidase family serine peptidase [Pseudomonadota bacterium]